MNAYHLAWRGCASVLWLLGILVSLLVLGGSALVAIAIGAALLGVAVLIIVHAPSGTGSSPATYAMPSGTSLAAVAVGSAAAGIAVIGLFHASGGVAAIVLIILAGTAPMRHSTLARTTRTLTVPAAPTSLVARAPSWERVSNIELGRRWRTSFAHLQNPGSAQEWADLVQTRTELLDELARRDPHGFARWIGSGAGAASDPARYVLKGTPDRSRNCDS